MKVCLVLIVVLANQSTGTDLVLVADAGNVADTRYATPGVGAVG